MGREKSKSIKIINRPKSELIELKSNPKGITLIALVITVVVMLILAGVAISVLVDGDGLFTKTRTAAEEYKTAAEEEASTVSDWVAKIDEYLSGTPSNPGGGNGNGNDDDTTTDPEETITFERGTGTEADPYVIVNAEQLEYLASQVALGTTFENQYISLEENIELNSGKWQIDEDGNITFAADTNQWTPIGNSTNPFKGNFDGNSKYISGIYINDENKTYCGLFGKNDGKITNLGIKNSYVKAKFNASLLVGFNNGEIENVIVKSSNLVAHDTAGGISGGNNRKNNLRH